MPRRSLAEFLEYHQSYAGDVAIVQQRGYRRETWSYRQLLIVASQFAHELEKRAIRKGERIIIWGENNAEWIAAFIGAMMRGVVVVPMDKVGSTEFVSRVAQQTNAKLVVHSQELVSLTGMPSMELEQLSQQVAHHATAPFIADLQRGDVLQIVFTSGTTSEPRGVVTTHGNVLANLEPIEREINKYRKYGRWFHPLRFLNTVPLSHVFGQFMGAFVPPLIGATTVFPGTLNPGEIIRTIKRERVSLLISVPRLVQSLQQKIEGEQQDKLGADRWQQLMAERKGEHWVWRWLRFRKIHRQLGWKFWAIISGGASLDAGSIIFWERLGYVVLQGYGLTETTSLISVDHPFQRGRGSIGKVLAGREMRLSESGEILVRGESIAQHYFQGGELKPVGGEEGWFHTGDLGELDEHGYLHFKGRKKNVIVTPEGMKVYPADLEAALRQQPEVKDCIVFGIDRNGNAEPSAALLLAGGSAEAAVRRANESLAPYQHIRRFVVWPEADFPRTSTHKARVNVIQQYATETLSGAPIAPGERGELGELIARIRGRSGEDGQLGLSSLERVELMCALEERYQIELNETRFAEAQTVQDIERLIAQPAATKTEYSYPEWAQRWPITWLRWVSYHLLAWPVTLLLSGVKAIGSENLRGIDGPVLFVSNHLSYFDGPLVQAALPYRFRNRFAMPMEGERFEAMRRGERYEMMVREADRWYWRLLLPHAYRAMIIVFNVFPLPKLSGFRESFAFAGKLADKGQSILVFPEGRRTETGAVGPFMRGTGLLADGLKLPIVPVRIDGLWELRKRGVRGFAPRGSVHVKIGEPVRYEPGTAQEEIARDLERRVKAL